MYCVSCGKQIPADSKFCGFCGAVIDQVQKNPSAGYPSLGFSPRINDPAFDKYRKNSSKWAFIFALILAVIASIGFPIYGNASGDIDWPASLYYGLGIGGMFLVIAAIQTIRKKSEKTWDGVVEYKDSFRRRNNNQEDTVSYDQMYVIKVRKDDGGTKKHTWRNMPGLYNYYNTGDRVRHHKGFDFYEKYDKTKDTQILCAACLTMNDIADDVCRRCKCPLLK